MKQTTWINITNSQPEPFKEVLVWIDGKRGASWRNNHALVAYMNENGQWVQERHPDSDPLRDVLYWMEIPLPG